MTLPCVQQLRGNHSTSFCTRLWPTCSTSCTWRFVHITSKIIILNRFRIIEMHGSNVHGVFNASIGWSKEIFVVSPRYTGFTWDENKYLYHGISLRLVAWSLFSFQFVDSKKRSVTSISLLYLRIKIFANHLSLVFKDKGPPPSHNATGRVW